jgi:hypothetical protein
MFFLFIVLHCILFFFFAYLQLIINFFSSLFSFSSFRFVSTITLFFICLLFVLFVLSCLYYILALRE